MQVNQKLRSVSVWAAPAMLVVVVLSTIPMLPYNWLPVLFNIFEREFSANLEQQGTTQQYFFISGLLLVVLGGRLTDRLGPNFTAAFAIMTCAAGLFLLGSAPSFGVVLAGCFVYGFGMAWLYLFFGVYVTRAFPQQRQKAFLINNMILSVAGGSGPLFLGFWVSSGHHWRTAFLAVACANALLFTFFLLGHRRLPQPDSEVQNEAAPRAATDSLSHVLLSRALWITGLLYVLHGIAEIGIISWAPKLYSLRLGLPESRMAVFMSANIIAFATGRFLLSFLAGRFTDRILLALCALGGTLFFVLVFLAPGYYSGLLFMAASGVCMSGNYPAMSAYLGSRFTTSLSVAFAVFQGFGAVGSAVASRLIGYLGDRAGLELAVWVVPLASGLLALIALLFEVSDRRTGRAPA
ncbi:MAG: sugar MFS transporter [Acidobacteriota bacterium]